MGDIIYLRPEQDIPTALRNMADAIERGELTGKDCTLILGMDVFHVGCIDDERAAADAVFNMSFGIQKVLHPAVTASFEQ